MSYEAVDMDSKGKTTTLTGISAWKNQLVTKEDPTHIHKTLGIACMLSYIFRIAQTGPSDMGFARFPALTVPTIVLHLLLNLTALEFKIPARRISSGYRIWPEYRLHSLVFLARALAIMTVLWCEQTFHRPPNHDWNLAIVIAAMIAADLSSYSQRRYASSTIRDLDTAAWVKFLFSAAQFFGTANILYGLRYRYSIHFTAVVIIQCNAFMMTLRRKNLAGHTMLVTLYGLALLLAAVVDIYENHVRVDRTVGMTVGMIGEFAIVQRMAPWPAVLRPVISNKYVVWITVGLVLRQARPWLESGTVTASDIMAVWVVALVLFSAVGWYKSFGPGSKQKNDDATTMKAK